MSEISLGDKTLPSSIIRQECLSELCCDSLSLMKELNCKLRAYMSEISLGDKTLASSIIRQECLSELCTVL